MNGICSNNLRDAGLTKVGVVKFTSCHAGRKDFLERFSAELSRLGVSHG
jgi:hypothetical protein